SGLLFMITCESIPRIIDLNFNDINNFINETSEKTYNLSHEIGGSIPYTIIKEIIENLIHADFKEVVITVLDRGNHIIVTDQGPGIEDKEKAFLPGYTTATSKMKEYIRGVGSGFPIIKETITFSGGSIDVKDNIKRGTVISLKLGLTKDGEKVHDPGSEPAAVPPSGIESEKKTQIDILDKFNGKILLPTINVSKVYFVLNVEFFIFLFR
ncbi:unnamed protein product, partial [marine sediment metagenome]